MATTTEDQARWLLSRIAEQMLTRAGEPERRDQLKDALKSWLPDADEFELRRVAAMVGPGLGGLANMLTKRRERMEANGTAVEVR